MPHRLPMTQIPLNRLAVVATIIGVLTGLFVAALNWAAIGMERLVYGADHLNNANPTADVTPARLAVTLVVLGFVMSWAWFIVHRWGRQPVSVVGALRGDKMPLPETAASAFLQVTTVAAGAPVGAENAPRLAGSLVGERISHWLRLDLDATRILVASAAGAALGASFHLPLAGVLFSLEVLLVETSTRTVVISVVTTTAAVATTGLFVPIPSVFTTVPLNEDPYMLLLAVIVGAIAGLGGHFFSRAATHAAARAPRGPAILWQMPLGFAIIAAIVYAYPTALANPRSISDHLLNDDLLIPTLLGLLALLALRVLLFLIAFRVGTIGGNLMPSFALGTIIGALVGTLLHPLINLPIPAAALLGAAAFLSTAMAAPLFGLIAAVEFTDMEPQGYLPIFLTVASAILAVRLFTVLTDQTVRAMPITYANWTGELK